MSDTTQIRVRCPVDLVDALDTWTAQADADLALADVTRSDAIRHLLRVGLEQTAAGEYAREERIREVLATDWRKLADVRTDARERKLELIQEILEGEDE